MRKLAKAFFHIKKKTSIEDVDGGDLEGFREDVDDLEAIGSIPFDASQGAYAVADGIGKLYLREMLSHPERFDRLPDDPRIKKCGAHAFTSFCCSFA